MPGGGHLTEQADGTAWVALFCQNMFEIAIESAANDASYVDIALKFVDHFLCGSLSNGDESVGTRRGCVGGRGEDGFYYDVLCACPDGTATWLKVRSIVGLWCCPSVRHYNYRAPGNASEFQEAVTDLLDHLENGGLICFRVSIRRAQATMA